MRIFRCATTMLLLAVLGTASATPTPRMSFEISPFTLPVGYVDAALSPDGRHVALAV